ncbi:uncharacterized protein DUF4287 [Roseivirga ehrenbergii]|uniref:DUF5655 domain-containing protein n=1 Tax=Roseivirga ehrenbergii (strain DSM 102268 / JCM 13514 / KCTC 12282 / NCIMB 14502 / KMM 6017) TaxID=279360 RepID=A0A150XSI5_ROSEK|nr:DUF4287 domain-containing protein [Roseivirga ehrenbergii]KYG81681.1 hypothetical protein MB14_13950 [Roseivirga ehrenbergii]TCL10856.1 uncharacterized protein DUF4287 [Roseivirga ehrenbergii]
MATPEEMAQTMINNLPEKTGKSITEWRALLATSGLQKHGEIIKLLKGEHGVTHGFANLIAQLYLKPDLLENKVAENPDEDLLAGKEAIAEVYKKAKALFENANGEVEFAYKKTYISLRTPKKQFGLLQPSTKTRVDIGLNLKGVEPEGIVAAAGSWNSMVTHRIKLSSVEDVDASLATWVQKAYDANS